MCSFNIVRIEENAGLRFGDVVILKPEKHKLKKEAKEERWDIP